MRDPIYELISYCAWSWYTGRPNISAGIYDKIVTKDAKKRKDGNKFLDEFPAKNDSEVEFEGELTQERALTSFKLFDVYCSFEAHAQ